MTTLLKKAHTGTGTHTHTGHTHRTQHTHTGTNTRTHSTHTHTHKNSLTGPKQVATARSAVRSAGDERRVRQAVTTWAVHGGITNHTEEVVFVILHENGSYTATREQTIGMF